MYLLRHSLVKTLFSFMISTIRLQIAVSGELMLFIA
jgi:hypothetical protein